MKIITALLFMFLCIGASAQKTDTLNVPLGKYKFIKVGDKVYELITTLKEVKVEQRNDTMRFWNGGGLTLPYSTYDGSISPAWNNADNK